MEIKKFLELMDYLRFDPDTEETNEELVVMARKCYPIIRKMYNMVCEAGLIDDDIFESKKHNSPKDKYSAERKGNRDAEREIYGDGFRSKDKIHKVKNDYDRKNNRFDINNIEDEDDIFESKKLSHEDLMYIITESIKKHINEISK